MNTILERNGKEERERRNGNTRSSIRRRNAGVAEVAGNSNGVPASKAGKEQKTVKNHTIY